MLSKDTARMLCLVQHVDEVHFSWLSNHRHVRPVIGFKNTGLGDLIRSIRDTKLQERFVNVIKDEAVRAAVRIHVGGSEELEIVELGIDSDNVVTEMLVDMLFMAHFGSNAAVEVC